MKVITVETPELSDAATSSARADLEALVVLTQALGQSGAQDTADTALANARNTASGPQARPRGNAWPRARCRPSTPIQAQLLERRRQQSPPASPPAGSSSPPASRSFDGPAADVTSPCPAHTDETLAEADGNRTRLAEILDHRGFEDQGGHQAP